MEFNSTQEERDEIDRFKAQIEYNHKECLRLDKTMKRITNEKEFEVFLKEYKKREKDIERLRGQMQGFIDNLKEKYNID